MSHTAAESRRATTPTGCGSPVDAAGGVLAEAQNELLAAKECAVDPLLRSSADRVVGGPGGRPALMSPIRAKPLEGR